MEHGARAGTLLGIFIQTHLVHRDPPAVVALGTGGKKHVREFGDVVGLKPDAAGFGS